MSDDTGSGPADVDIITSAGTASLDAARERRVEFAELTARKKSIAADVRKLEKDMRALERQVIEDYAELGTDSMRADAAGARWTIYLRSDLRASPQRTGEKDGKPTSTDEDWAQAVAALRAAGLGHLVQERFNSNSLSAWLREFRKDNGPNWRDELPPELAVLRIDVEPRLGVDKVAK